MTAGGACQPALFKPSLDAAFKFGLIEQLSRPGKWLEDAEWELPIACSILRVCFFWKIVFKLKAITADASYLLR